MLKIVKYRFDHTVFERRFGKQTLLSYDLIISIYLTIYQDSMKTNHKKYR